LSVECDAYYSALVRDLAGKPIGRPFVDLYGKKVDRRPARVMAELMITLQVELETPWKIELKSTGSRLILDIIRRRPMVELYIRSVVGHEEMTIRHKRQLRLHAGRKGCEKIAAPIIFCPKDIVRVHFGYPYRWMKDQGTSRHPTRTNDL
jgi:hypothetical protein